MKKAAFITLALVSAFATAQTANNSAYKAAHDKAESTYKAAKKQCDKLKEQRRGRVYEESESCTCAGRTRCRGPAQEYRQ
jgi:hyperosmotically inducible protein